MEDTFGNLDPTTADPSKINDLFDTMETKVPSDLKDDIETLRNAVLPFYEAIQAAGGDMTKAVQDPKVQQAMTAMSSADVQAATKALEDWTTAGCPSS